MSLFANCSPHSDSSQSQKRYDKESIKVLCNMSNEAAEYVIGDITRDYNVRERERVTLECQFDSFIRLKNICYRYPQNSVPFVVRHFP